MRLAKNVIVTCRMCKVNHTVVVGTKDLRDWQDGALIQSVMPYLKSSERELLISKTCDDCWNKMFGGNDDDESDEDWANDPNAL